MLLLQVVVMVVITLRVCMLVSLFSQVVPPVSAVAVKWDTVR